MPMELHQILFCLFTVAVNRTSYLDVVIRYVLPVLKITTCFHIMGPMSKTQQAY